MPNSSRKGSKQERELVNELDGRGFAVMRAPASGGATTRELPDVLAGDGEMFYAIEAKASSGDPIYIQQEKIEGLEYFSKGFTAISLVGARFDEKHGDPTYGDEMPGWYFLNPSNLYRTDAGTYRVKKETAIAEGVTLDCL